jgi:hypothetical protein
MRAEGASGRGQWKRKRRKRRAVAARRMRTCLQPLMKRRRGTACRPLEGARYGRALAHSQGIDVF